jgi:hypothetical protein
VALTYLQQGALDEVMQRVIPEHVLASAAEDNDDFPELLIRLHRPRFIAAIVSAEAIPPDAEFVWIAEGIEALVVAMWIDNPAAPPGWNATDLLRRAAAAAEVSTQEAFDSDA